MWNEQTLKMIGKGVLETLYMTGFSTLFSYVFGTPFGIILAVTELFLLKDFLIFLQKS